MNRVQVDLEYFRMAAHRIRYEPGGKPFAKACDLIERLERFLRSIKQCTDPMMMRQLAHDALEGGEE